MLDVIGPKDAKTGNSVWLKHGAIGSRFQCEKPDCDPAFEPSSESLIVTPISTSASIVLASKEAGETSAEDCLGVLVGRVARSRPPGSGLLELVRGVYSSLGDVAIGDPREGEFLGILGVRTPKNEPAEEKCGNVWCSSGRKYVGKVGAPRAEATVQLRVALGQFGYRDGRLWIRHSPEASLFPSNQPHASRHCSLRNLLGVFHDPLTAVASTFPSLKNIPHRPSLARLQGGRDDSSAPQSLRVLQTFCRISLVLTAPLFKSRPPILFDTSHQRACPDGPTDSNLQLRKL